MTITPEEVAKLAAAATPGPWQVADDGEDVWSGDDVVCGWAGIDAPFISAAHDMAALIAELKAERDALMEAMTTEPTDEMLASACMWHRHDFGLFDEERRREWMLVAKEWWRASAKEMRHRAALAKIKEKNNE